LTSLATTANPDGGIQGQQVGLAGDVLDQGHDFADLEGPARKALDHGVGAAGLVGRLAGDLGRARRLVGDLADRGRQFFGRGGHGSDIERGLRRRRGGRGGLSRCFVAAVAHRRGHALHFAGGHGDRLDDMADLALELGGEAAHRSVAFQPGALIGFASLGIGAGLGGVGGFGFRRLLRRGHEQLGQPMGHPDQHAGFEDENTGVKHHASKIGSAGEYR
jgi:hypothetical protein